MMLQHPRDADDDEAALTLPSLASSASLCGPRNVSVPRVVSVYFSSHLVSLMACQALDPLQMKVTFQMFLHNFYPDDFQHPTRLMKDYCQRRTGISRPGLSLHAPGHSSVSLELSWLELSLVSGRSSLLKPAYCVRLQLVVLLPPLVQPTIYWV